VSVAEDNRADNDSPARSAKPHWGDARTKTVEWHDPAVGMAAVAEGLSGLEFIRAIRDGHLPGPPIGALTGMYLREVDPGRVVFECVVDESLYNPMGIVHGGLLCTLADSVAGCAVLTTLAPGVLFTSIELNVQFLRPVRIESGTLRGIGTVSKTGRRVTFATAEIRDSDDDVVATATTSCLIVYP
jgi:uncharacterized protein (TIGR00369 family)